MSLATLLAYSSLDFVSIDRGNVIFMSACPAALWSPRSYNGVPGSFLMHDLSMCGQFAMSAISNSFLARFSLDSSGMDFPSDVCSVIRKASKPATMMPISFSMVSSFSVPYENSLTFIMAQNCSNVTEDESIILGTDFLLNSFVYFNRKLDQFGIERKPRAGACPVKHCTLKDDGIIIFDAESQTCVDQCQFYLFQTYNSDLNSCQPNVAAAILLVMFVSFLMLSEVGLTLLDLKVWKNVRQEEVDEEN